MEKITADYRTWPGYFALVFLFFWSIAFGGMSLNGLLTKSQDVTINHRQATPQEGSNLQLVMALVGLAVFICAICLVVMTVNRKVEIDGNEITSVSWKGEVQLKTTLDQVQSIKGTLMDTRRSNINRNAKRYLVTTTKGDFSFDDTMRNSGAVKEAIDKAILASTPAPLPIDPGCG